MSTPITKLLVANRGEIACRVMRTARDLGISAVAVFSDADVGAPFVALADEGVRLPGSTPSETYLRGDLIVDAARLIGMARVSGAVLVRSGGRVDGSACAVARGLRSLGSARAPFPLPENRVHPL